ncbi:MBL fold metallo-hydrolase [Oceanihabitans sp. IOP_32]|uniref:MBL fold metallo-hydrolase n=1 Tax=Oceanihabitans sp. IOP_32 TaxID=2529032 RepID=UPI001293A89D|nr:MBL fold metallo-hydrolase [Oceanihabitans sp. IOP_32]QFZ55896.1 MBL fold metallo-hydrolase [Oceanihabitans sp. IOP_32]
MKITFLGTGTSQGIPVIGCKHPVCLSDNPKDKRLRVSVLIEWNDFAYVIDCGPDFRQQMLNCGCEKINGILFTHEHADHVAGIDDIRPLCYMNGDMQIYAHERVIESIKNRFAYIFVKENKYPGSPTIITNSIENKPFNLSGMDVIPINADHYFVQVYGYRFNNFAYLTDIKTVDDQELEKLKNLKVLVLNALRIEPHISHLNLDEALAFVEKVKPEKAYFTHISHLLGFHDEVEKTLPQNVHLAYDGLQLDI